MAFDLVDGELTPTKAIRRETLAARCERWVRQRSVGVRSVRRSSFLHGKTYLADREFSIVGSSNFTKSGLGGGANPNLEINLTGEEMRQWFDRLLTDGGLAENMKPKDVRSARGNLHAPRVALSGLDPGQSYPVSVFAAAGVGENSNPSPVSAGSRLAPPGLFLTSLPLAARRSSTCGPPPFPYFSSLRQPMRSWPQNSH